MFAIFFLLTSSAFAYECRPVQIGLKLKDDRKSDLQLLKASGREALFEGLIFELTSNDLAKSPKKARKIAEFLLNTEPNEDQRALLKLLKHASDLDSSTPRALNLAEVCEINEKVNELPKAANKKH
jgi:hypothetical protein